MPRRSLLSTSAREIFFGIPTDLDDLVRHYLLSPEDMDLIRTRRRDENRLGLAVHLALLRYPGQGWQDGTVLPAVFLEWIADQLHLSPVSLSDYTGRGATRAAHHAMGVNPT